MIQLALFDIDGTLFDTERLWAEALSLLMEEKGVRAKAQHLSEITYGLAWPDAFAALQRTYPRPLGDAHATRFGQELCVIFDRLFSLAPPVIEGSVAILHRFRAAGIPCGYVSGSPRRTIETNLRRCGLSDCFDLECSVPSDDAPRGKPFPDGYALAMERFGVPPEVTVAFEDSRVGATAALTAGITTYVCPPPGAPEQTYPEGIRRLSDWSEALPLLFPDGK